MLGDDIVPNGDWVDLMILNYGDGSGRIGDTVMVMKWIQWRLDAAQVTRPEQLDNRRWREHK